MPCTSFSVYWTAPKADSNGLDRASMVSSDPGWLGAMWARMGNGKLSLALPPVRVVMSLGLDGGM